MFKTNPVNTNRLSRTTQQRRSDPLDSRTHKLRNKYNLFHSVYPEHQQALRVRKQKWTQRTKESKNKAGDTRKSNYNTNIQLLRPLYFYRFHVDKERLFEAAEMNNIGAAQRLNHICQGKM